jgi:hypothetical protein
MCIVTDNEGTSDIDVVSVPQAVLEASIVLLTPIPHLHLYASIGIVA